MIFFQIINILEVRVIFEVKLALDDHLMFLYLNVVLIDPVILPFISCLHLFTVLLLEC